MRSLHRLRETVTVAGLIVPAIYLLARWRSLPLRMAVHFDLHGNPNGYGSRASLFLLPAIALAMYALLYVVARLPLTFNLPVPPGSPARACYEEATVNLLGWLRLELVWMFAAWSWIEVRMAEGHRSGFLLLIPMQLVILVGTAAFFMVRMRRRCGATG